MPKPRGHHRSNKLTARAVVTATKDTCDGGGLWLQVSAFKTKSWLFKYQWDGKPRKMGLGPLRVVSLAKARELAAVARLKVLEGVDPVADREAVRAARRLDAAKSLTFKACAESYIAANRAGWRSSKHAAEWAATLATHIFPVFGDLSVAAIDVPLVVKALEPIWSTRTETASRLRGRIELVLDYAKARGYRDGPNPAVWKGGLKAILPAPSKVARVEHHAALSVAEIPTFMTRLRAREGVAAQALEFTILVAARLGETLGATWGEIDTIAKLWTVPASKMKAGREHVVPLSPRVMSILESAPRQGERIFPVSPMTMQRIMRSMHANATVHGFRSSFRDWCGDATRFPREVAEAALAHATGDATERAYRRGDALEKRRKLMDAWAAYCERVPADTGGVVPLRAAQ